MCRLPSLAKRGWGRFESFKSPSPPLFQRGRRRSQLALYILLIVLTIRSATADIELSGYYKNLFVNSKTLSLFPPGESYLLDLNRLRLKLVGNLSERIAFDIQYDNEVFLGDYLDTTEFISLLKNRKLDTHFDLDDNYIDNSNLYGSHRLYRAYADFTLPEVDLRLGRQRIAWGTAMLWNPMDILNPFNPTQLERQERQGIDAVLMDWNYNALSRMSLVYTKQQSGTSSAVRWRSNQKGFDLSLMAGRFRGDNVAGFDFSGQIADIGVRGEITETNPENERSFTRVVVGADYTFASSLSLNIEMYYNGQGLSDPVGYEFNRLLSGEVQSLARRYLGVYLGYDITALLKLDSYLIINLNDDSAFFAPRLLYSLTESVDGSVGVQAFNGDSGTEYGTFESLYFVQLQWFF